MSRSEFELVVLRGGLTVPAGAILAVLNLERAGHRLTLNAAFEHIDIEAATGVPIDEHDLAQLRRWKQHAILFMTCTRTPRTCAPTSTRWAHQLTRSIDDHGQPDGRGTRGAI